MAFGPSSSESSPSPLSSDVGFGPLRSPSESSETEITAEVARRFAELDLSAPQERASSSNPGDDAPSLADPPDAARTRRPSAAFSWPNVILGSYASAVTLALIWVLATGKTLPRHRVQAPNREFEAPPLIFPRAFEPIAPDGSVNLGETIAVGDLEVMPLMVLHRTARISEGAGLEDSGQEVPNCLTLTIRLKNTSVDRELTPLEPPSAWNEGFGEAHYVELGTRRRILALALNWESNEAIDSQSPPVIAPGAVADVVLVSEPVAFGRLAGPLTWWITLRTGEDETETIGVRFSRRDVSEVGG